MAAKLCRRRRRKHTFTTITTTTTTAETLAMNRPKVSIEMTPHDQEMAWAR